MSKIVLLGDSIVQYMPYFYKGQLGCNEDEVVYHGIENIGIGTYKKYVWPKMEDKDADVYILLIGINNICRPDCDYDDRESLEETIAKLKELIHAITSTTSSRLIVQSIYPTKYFDSNQEVKKVNEQLAKHCKKINVEYLDLYSLLVDESGLFNKEYTDDGIHPNSIGYGIIAKELSEKIQGKEKNKLLVKKGENTSK